MCGQCYYCCCISVRTRCSRHIQVRLVCTVSACTLSMRVRCTQRRRPSQATARHPTKAGRRSNPPSAPPLARASSSHDGPTRVPQARPSAPPPSCGARQTKTMDKATDRDLDLENARACPPPMLRVMWRRRTYVDRRCASLSSSFRPTSQARTRRGAIMPFASISREAGQAGRSLRPYAHDFRLCHARCCYSCLVIASHAGCYYSCLAALKTHQPANPVG